MKEKIIKTIIQVYQPEELQPEIQQLIEEAKKQTHQSYAPYSNFGVGAAILLENGEIVTGNNQENAAYPSGFCAERVAVMYANSKYPDVPVKAIAIAAFYNGSYLMQPITPCGGCRQVLLETENRYNQELEIYMYGAEQVYHITGAHQLIPLSFGKTQLL